MTETENIEREIIEKMHYITTRSGIEVKIEVTIIKTGNTEWRPGGIIQDGPATLIDMGDGNVKATVRHITFCERGQILKIWRHTFAKEKQEQALRDLLINIEE